MIFSPKQITWAILLITSLLAACKTTQAQEAKPAIMTDTSSEARKIMALAASKAVGSNVTLAPDSFRAKPSVTIEPASVNKRNGRIIDGRSMEMPTHIDLIMMGRECYVLNRTTGEKYPVKGVRCKPVSIP